MMTTEADCHLNGVPIALASLPRLSSQEIAQIVGFQEPGGEVVDAQDYDWTTQTLRLADLEESNDDGEAPEGGWKAAYFRHQADDMQAVDEGSPEYAGRQTWLAHWCQDTRIYPLYVVREDDGYRLLDGYHRLAGAFFHDISGVFVFVGTPTQHTH